VKTKASDYGGNVILISPSDGIGFVRENRKVYTDAAPVFCSVLVTVGVRMRFGVVEVKVSAVEVPSIE